MSEPVTDDQLATIGRGKRALVIEDDEASRDFAHTALLQMGFEVQVAEDGLIALNFLDAVETDHFELAICDIQIPRLSGLSLMAKVRQRGHMPVRHLIFLSAIDDAGIKQQGMDLGAVAFLTKPVALAKLRAEVKRALAISQP